MKKILFLATAIFLQLALLLAHPHTFIENNLNFEFANKQLTGVWVNWEFDEMFSTSIIQEADMDNNGVFNETETKYLYDNAFINLENYGYFFFIRNGSERTSPTAVQKFSAKAVNGKLRYKFFIPLKAENNQIIISLIDPSFYCAVNNRVKNPVTFINATALTPTYKISKNKSYPVYYDPQGAIDDTSIHTKWMQGLITTYPEEIIVTF